MHTYAVRAARSPLALMLVAAVALTACADEPVAPRSLPAVASTAALAPGEIQLTVTNTTDAETGSLRWALAQVNGSNSPSAVVTFDPSLGGDTITVSSTLPAQRPVRIVGPAKGITLKGNGQYRLISGGTSLALKNLTLTGGFADRGSAAMAPSLSLTNTTVLDNSGPASAIYGGDVLQLINSTVSRNVVGRPAVEFGPYAYVTVDNSTIAYNAPGAGFGPSSPPGAYNTILLRNSIIASNGTPRQNCSTYANLSYQGTNVVDDWSCADVAITPSDPLLMPLANNGGPNMTHAIPHTSPAYNAGTNCVQTTDQRYVARDAKCDVGAFEFNDSTKVSIGIDQTVRLDAAAGHATLTGTMKCSRDETIMLWLELRQDQKAGKNVNTVHTTENVQVACSPTTTTWARKMVLSSGAWQAGAAQATAKTIATPDWVAPTAVTSAVKLAIIRK